MMNKIGKWFLWSYFALALLTLLLTGPGGSLLPIHIVLIVMGAVFQVTEDRRPMRLLGAVLLVFWGAAVVDDVRLMQKEKEINRRLASRFEGSNKQSEQTNAPYSQPSPQVEKR